MVHSCLKPRLIRHELGLRHEWEASLLNVELSKTLRIKAQRHFRIGQYLIGKRFVPPTIVIRAELRYSLRFST